jgi:hypothetical protein
VSSDAQQPEPLCSSVPYGQCYTCSVVPHPALPPEEHLWSFLGSGIGYLARRSKTWAQRGSGLGRKLHSQFLDANYGCFRKPLRARLPSTGPHVGMGTDGCLRVGVRIQTHSFSFRSLSLQSYYQNLLADHQAGVGISALSSSLPRASLENWKDCLGPC